MDIEEVLDRDGFYIGTPVGESMWPLLHGRVDSVVLRKENDPKKYEVVLYRRENGQLVLHRYYGKDGKGRLRFAGDNQIHFEKQSEGLKILAVMIAYYRGEKKYYVDSKALAPYNFIWGKLFFPRVPVVAAQRAIKKIKRASNRKKAAKKAK